MSPKPPGASRWSVYAWLLASCLQPGVFRSGREDPLEDESKLDDRNDKDEALMAEVLALDEKKTDRLDETRSPSSKDSKLR